MLCTGGFKSRSKTSKRRDYENKENLGGALQTTLPYEPSNQRHQGELVIQGGGGPLRQPLRSRNDYALSPIKGSPMRHQQKTHEDKPSGCFPKRHRRRKSVLPPTGPSNNNYHHQQQQQATSGFSAYSPWVHQVRHEGTDHHNISTASHTYATLRRSVSVSSSLSAVSDASRLTNIGLRGHLKLAVTVKSNRNICVQIVEAKQLRYQEREGAAFYVKVSLVQEDVCLSTFVTQIVYDSQRPYFDEQFDIPISATDRRKRINIAVIQMKGTVSEQIGCMSFGVRHLLLKGRNVKGWFYLLNEEIGRRKHLRLASTNQSSTSIFSDDDIQSLSPVNQGERIVTGASDSEIVKEYPRAPYNSHMLPSNEKYQQHSIKMSSARPDHNANVYMSNYGKLNPIMEDEMEVEHPRCEMIHDTHLYKKTEVSISDVATSESDDVNDRQFLESSTSATPATMKSEVLSSSYYDNTGEYTYTDLEDADESYFEEESFDERETLDVVEQECWQIITQLRQKRSYAMSTSDVSVQGHLATTVRTRHLQRLMSLEEDYLAAMSAAAQRYSRPLRHCILTPNQHKLLFQNVEKLIVISQLHVKRLHEEMEKVSCATATEESRVGNIYRPHLKLFSEAYAGYCNGLPQAIDVLSQCKRGREFTSFIRTRNSDPDQMTLLEFIKRPAQHLESLLKHFDSMMLDLPMTSLDFDDVRNVLEALRDCLKEVPIEVLRRSSAAISQHSQSQTSLASSHNTRGSHSHLPKSGQMSRATSVGSVRSCSTVFSVDNELASLQNKVVFPQNLRTQSLLAPNRHVIYSGDVMWVDGWKWVQVHLVLLSDILLFGAINNGQIEAQQEPISLRDVLTLDFDCFHPCEFALSVRLPGSNGITSLVFRTSHPDHKTTWRHLLEQRVNTCQSQMEFYL